MNILTGLVKSHIVCTTARIGIKVYYINHALLNSPVGLLCLLFWSQAYDNLYGNNGILKGLWMGPVRHETLYGGLTVCLSQFQLCVAFGTSCGNL